jgi:hypothetical protein
VNADIAALGLDATHYSLERMTTSASDMLYFVELLARGKMVSASASADMVHLLLRQRVNDRLPHLLPNGVAVAHKTGNLPGTVNDVGIIFGPSSTLAVAVLVSDTTDETAAASAIATLALAAFTYFEDQPAIATRPTVPRPPSRAIPPVWRVPQPVPTATAIATITPTPTVGPMVESTAGPTPTPALSRPTVMPTRPAATAVPGQATATSVTPAPSHTPTRPPTPAATATAAKR